jgi:hypothetical protein
MVMWIGLGRTGGKRRRGWITESIRTKSVVRYGGCPSWSARFECRRLGNRRGGCRGRMGRLAPLSVPCSSSGADRHERRFNEPVIRLLRLDGLIAGSIRRGRFGMGGVGKRSLFLVTVIACTG